MYALPSTRGVVDVVWAVPLPEPAVANLLTADEAHRIARLRPQADRARSATGRALLRAVAARVLGVEPGHVAVEARCATCGGPHGQPHIVTPARSRTLHVSVAHAADRVVVAASTAGPVGVDVEPVCAADFPGFDGVALSMSERAEIDGEPIGERARTRTSLWVRKEAVLKMRGVGLAISPADVDARSGRARTLPGGWTAARRLQLVPIDLDEGYVAWLAVRTVRAPSVVVTDGRTWLASQAAPSRTTTA